MDNQIKIPKPIPLAMIICDTVIDDATTHKKTLVGVFNAISSQRVPALHSSLNVFICLTEGRGEYNGILRCVHSGSNKSVLELNGKINFTDIKEIIELNFELKGIVFPEFGEYRFEFLCNSMPLLSRRFTVNDLKNR